MAKTDKEDAPEKQSKDGAGDGDPGSKGKSENSCPECGEPIDNVRKTCANCGYEYKDDDYTDTEAGNEFLAGSNIDDEGEEITDKGPGVEEGAE